MNAAGPVHDDLIMYLTNWSARCTSPEKIMVTSQTGLRLSELQSRPEPDLMWLRAKRYRGRHPSAGDLLLAIEVVDSSLQSEMRDKGELYAEAGIVEYWMVDATQNRVHILRNPEGRYYTQRTVAGVGSQISPLCLPEVALDLRDLFLGD